MIDNDLVIVHTATMQEPQKDYVCQHVMQEKSNVVIEVHVCRSNKPLDNESIKIADQMAAKVDKLTRLL
jgi:PknH-like extracellular domain